MSFSDYEEYLRIKNQNKANFHGVDRGKVIPMDAYRNNNGKVQRVRPNTTNTMQPNNEQLNVNRSNTINRTNVNNYNRPNSNVRQPMNPPNFNRVQDGQRLPNTPHSKVVYRTGSKAKKRPGPIQRKLKNTVKKVGRVMQAGLVLFIVTGAIWGISTSLSNEPKEVSQSDKMTSLTIVVDEQITVDSEKVKTPIVKPEQKYTEEELLNYHRYCYYDEYQGEDYLFCPESYILELADFAINKLEQEYKQSGTLTPLEDGGFIPDCISPELVAALCLMESSNRIEDKNGNPIAANNKIDNPNSAKGILQQKPVFVTDANNYSLSHGGDGYTLEDRYNPLTAMEMCVTNLNRIYRAYLQKGRATYTALTQNGYSEEKILGALIVSYSDGEGNMSNWAKSGILEGVLSNPKKTNGYGAPYLRTVLGYMEDIQERNMDDMELN